MFDFERFLNFAKDFAALLFSDAHAV